MLNKIDGYHVTENWSRYDALDRMRIVPEGLLSVEKGSVQFGLCAESKLQDIDS